MNKIKRCWRVRLLDTRNGKHCGHDVVTSMSREEVFKAEKEFYEDTCLQLLSVTLSPNQNW